MGRRMVLSVPKNPSGVNVRAMQRLLDRQNDYGTQIHHQRGADVDYLSEVLKD